MQTLYTATATATAGRNGHARSSDGAIDLDLSIPKSMGGDGKPGATNPEQLFACGYAACFGGAVEFAARQEKTKIGAVKVTAHVSIGKNDEGGFSLAVKLEASIAGVSQDVARRLVDLADTICPYSNALRGNVQVERSVAQG